MDENTAPTHHWDAFLKETFGGDKKLIARVQCLFCQGFRRQMEGETYHPPRAT